MNKLTSVFGAVAMTAVVAAASVVPAQAQSGRGNNDDNDRGNRRERVIITYCDQNPRDRDCRDFRRGRWDRNDYDRFYNSRRDSLDNISSGIFGFTFGAIVGSAIANGNNNSNAPAPVYSDRGYSSHVTACFNRYRSYDEETDSFLGFDGQRHRCNL